MILIHGKPQIKQLELSVVSVQEIPARRTIGACPSHVLPQSVESVTFFRVFVGIIAIGHANVALERLDPVDLTGLLEGDRE